MKISEAFPGSWLKSADLGDEDHVVTVKEVHTELLGQGTDKQLKLVVEFDELDKALVCNKTNATTITKLYGDETDDWVGKRIVLWVNNDVQFGSEVVSAIRVRPRKPGAAPPVRKADGLLSYAEALDAAAQAGISVEELKAYLKSCGQNAYNAAKCTALVRQYIAGMNDTTKDDDSGVPF